jgi:hypothetical protein
MSLYFADLVMWDSHPLALGATPQQVWIDGIPQLSEPAVSTKPESFQHVPRTPNFDLEAAAAIKYDGLPPLTPKKVKDLVVFANVSSVFVADGVGGVMSVAGVGEGGVVIVKEGQVLCWGAATACSNHVADEDVEWVDLEGGSISCVISQIRISCLFNAPHVALALFLTAPPLDWRRFRARSPHTMALSSTLLLALSQAF